MFRPTALVAAGLFFNNNEKKKKKLQYNNDGTFSVSIYKTHHPRGYFNSFSHCIHFMYNYKQIYAHKTSILDGSY